MTIGAAVAKRLFALGLVSEDNLMVFAAIALSAAVVLTAFASTFAIRNRAELRGTRFELLLRQTLDDAFDENAVVCAIADAVAAAGGEHQLSAAQREACTRCERSRLATVRLIAASAHDASTDALTGLLNRRSLEARLPGVLDAEEMYAVAVADLDHFKALNDRWGHDAGDRAIRMFGDVLREATRSVDLLCRHGGEEFVIVFPGLTQAHAAVALERVRAILKANVRDSHLPQLTASFGIAEVAGDTSFDSVLIRADQALLRAKRNGRDQIVAATRPGKYHEIVRERIAA